jgi:hypothetical protein
MERPLGAPHAHLLAFSTQGLNLLAILLPNRRCCQVPSIGSPYRGLNPMTSEYKAEGL